MDTVRYDHTSLAGGRDTTPNLAALARSGASFSQAYAVGNESLYSHAALFTGRYPSEIAVPDYASFALPDGVPTLAGLLSAYGYVTAAFTGGGHVVSTFGFGRGFDSFHAASGDARFGSFFDSVPLAAAWIDAHAATPWFAFVHGYDAHSPYVQRGPFLHPWGAVGATPRIESILADPVAVEQLRGDRWYPGRTPDDFVHAAGRRVLGTDFYALPAEPAPGEEVVPLTPAEVAHVHDHYDSGLLYGDLWLGVLLSHVDLSRTLVIVVADHGEDVLDHGFMNHRSGLWDSTLHVPLVVAGPGFPPGAPRPGLVDLRSVVPTVARAVGAVPPAGVSASPLQDPAPAPVVYAEGVMDMVTARSAAGRLTIRSARLASGAPDLASVPLTDPRVTFAPADSDRDAPVTPAELPAAEALRAAIVSWRAGLHPASTPGAAVPPALRDALRARGYWTPDEAAP
jgi:arylsulfatase A-like enzyme